MRYYIYLNRCLLRNLFSAVEGFNFNIEVVEYSVSKSCTKNNDFSIEPGIESMCDSERERGDNKEDKKPRRFRNSNFKKERLGAMYGHRNSSTIETHRRYINIEDITEMKNSGFYHNLIRDIRTTVLENNRQESNRIIEETGFIKMYNRTESATIKDEGNNGFFMVNDTCVWFDKDKLEGDISLLSQMGCEIKVLGYKVNCNSNSSHIIKAIAMFIE